MQGWECDLTELQFNAVKELVCELYLWLPLEPQEFTFSLKSEVRTGVLISVVTFLYSIQMVLYPRQFRLGYTLGVNLYY